MTTAYLIDPARRTVEPVTYSDIADLQQLLDCSIVGTGGWFDSNHLILVDDNGLFDRPTRHFWRQSGRFEPVPHAAVVVGPDRTVADGTETPGDSDHPDRDGAENSPVAEPAWFRGMNRGLW